MSRRYWFPAAIFAIGWLLPASAVAQAYRSSAQAGATTGVLSLTVNKPAGTANGDVMIAAITVRPNTATITAPAGWTLIRRTDQPATNASSQATYQRIAGAAEPASYTWTFSTSTGSAGGIMTFYGVNTAALVDVENGQVTASGLTHAAPTVTTTKAYDMVVTTHSFTSAATWTPPGGMTEAVDVTSDAVPNAVGIALEMNYVVQPVAGATGARTATASNDADVGVGQTVALARGTTATWTGAASTLWVNGANWSGLGGTPLAGGEDLIFPGGAANLSNSNGVAAGTTFNSITITGSGYTLAGNSIVLGAGSLTDASIAGTNTLSLAISVVATRTVTVSNAGTTLTIGSVISGAGGITKAGAGTLVLSAANTFGGVSTVSAGVLDMRNNAALGGGVATTVASGAALQIDGTGLLIAEPITLNGTGIAAGGALRNLANNNTWSGAITLGTATRINSDAGTLTVSNTISGATQALTVGGAGNTTVSGVIATTSGTLTKDGTGTLTLSAANTYTGATSINVGTLKLGLANAVGATSAVTLAGGATFDLNAFSDVIGSLAGAGTVTSGVAGAVTLTAGGNNTSTTFSGIIQNGSGTVALTKAGTGTSTLSGASTYSGLTTVSAGVVDAQSNTALGTTAGATTVASGAALQVDGSALSIAEPITLNGTGIAAGGALRNLANSNTWSGAITLGSATRVNSDAGTLTVSTTIGGAAQALTVGGAGNTIVGGVISTTTGTFTKDGAGTVTLNANNTYTGTTTVSAGTLLVNGSQGSSAVSLNGGTLGGTGTVGAITSTALGGTVSPGPGPGILNSGNVNLSSGSPGVVVELNGTTVGSGYDRLNVTGTVNLNGATLSGTVGFATTDGMTFTIIANDGIDAITGTFAGLPEGSTVVLSGLAFKISYVGGTGNDVVLTRTAPTVGLASGVVPSGTVPPGTDLTYTLTFTNSGGSPAAALVLTDSVSANSDFKVGSVASNLGSTGLTVSVAYSNDGGTTWTYVPASGAGGAPAGYDRLVTTLRWTFTGSLSQTAPNNTGSTGFTARIR